MKRLRLALYLFFLMSLVLAFMLYGYTRYIIFVNPSSEIESSVLGVMEHVVSTSHIAFGALAWSMLVVAATTYFKGKVN